MRPSVLVLAVALLALAGPALADRYTAVPHPPSDRLPPPPANAPALAREQRLLALLSPAVRDWVAGAGPRQTGEGSALAAARSTVQRRYPDLFGPADLDAMAFLVLMNATHDSEADIRRQMERITAQNRASEALLQAHGSRDAKEAKHDPDKLSPEDQIRLQPYLNRKEALEAAISILMKADAEPNPQTLGSLK